MSTRDQIVETARSYLGVPWVHQGRTYQGIDCVGLLIAVAIKIGDLPTSFHYTSYRREPDGRTLNSLLCEYAKPIPYQNRQPADIIEFAGLEERWPSHVGILTPHPAGLGIIHSWAGGKKVVEHRFDEKWETMAVRAFAFPGVDK